ncbi:MAG: caspase family protein [Chloroflexota bacterium]
MDAPFDHGYALLIAVNESQMPNYALPTVAKDAAALHAVFVHPDRCAYLPENVRIIQGPEASREGIRAGLAWLQDKIQQDSSGNATAVVYYTGHGARDTSDNTFYLIPYDFGIPVRDTAIPATQFAAELESVQPRRLLVILDCCHAAGMNIKEQTRPQPRGGDMRPPHRNQPDCRSWGRGRDAPCSVPPPGRSSPTFALICP